MTLNPQDWMSALPGELWDIPLTDLAIPGSHDAMSYCLDINSPLVRSESDFFRLLDRFLYCFTRPVIFKWSTTQKGEELYRLMATGRKDLLWLCGELDVDQSLAERAPLSSHDMIHLSDKSIEEQLSNGIRFFDLRIAHKPNDPSSDLYFTHVIYTYLTVLETLLSVATWLESHPKEIVILACSHFEGMDNQCHEMFILSLKKLFGSKLCPRKESVLTLRSLWASGYQVILSYDSQTATRHPELWPDIPYLWANQRTAQGVISYLDWQKDLGRPDGFFISGLNLTADRCYITKNPEQSLRTLTFSNWDCLKKWVEEQTPGSDPKSLNIIAGDFVGPLPLCSLVIALNQKLVRKNGR